MGSCCWAVPWLAPPSLSTASQRPRLMGGDRGDRQARPGHRALYQAGSGGLCQTSSQVLLARLYDSALSSAGHRQTCCQCGFRNEEHEQTIYSDAENNSSADSSDSDDSDASSTSTNTTIRLSRNYSHHNILRSSQTHAVPAPVSPLQHSRSLSSLPESSLIPASQTRSSHNKLIRARGYSESSDADGKEHRRLSRKENVFSEKKPEHIQMNIDAESSEVTETETEEDGDTTTDAYDTIADEDTDDSKDEASETEEDKSDAESHYKSIKCQDDHYCYAYKDCLSPAALIKMENESVVSEVSEIV